MGGMGGCNGDLARRRFLVPNHRALRYADAAMAAESITPPSSFPLQATLPSLLLRPRQFPPADPQWAWQPPVHGDGTRLARRPPSSHGRRCGRRCRSLLLPRAPLLRLGSRDLFGPPSCIVPAAAGAAFPTAVAAGQEGARGQGREAGALSRQGAAATHALEEACGEAGRRGRRGGRRRYGWVTGGRGGSGRSGRGQRRRGNGGGRVLAAEVMQGGQHRDATQRAAVERELGLRRRQRARGG